ncbi:uncharacterized protein LOC122506332 [Leptopilina heterotoma]|uniref:uncharacterized protein LOC122506332 n=1 Tax=Leptopilina heterotoma TaxID=63436 RepID=UPI001CA90ACB|nr:uncharacterized protein LOC122506332 [Leptopilina heterotoma]
MSTHSDSSTNDKESLNSNSKKSISLDKEVKVVITNMEKLSVKDENSSPKKEDIDDTQPLDKTQQISNKNEKPSTSHGKHSSKESYAHDQNSKNSSEVQENLLKDRMNFKVTTQNSRLNLMIESFNQVKSFAPQYSVNEAKSMLTVFHDLWTEFSQTHEEIGETCPDSFFSNPYMTDDCYEQACKVYVESKILLNSLIERLKQPAANTTQPSESTQTKRRQLPEISLPQFCGDYSSWTPFRDLFSSLVGQNSEISGVEKMHYLCTTLTGKAAQLIANLPLSSDSFDSAWSLLTSRYENKRLLISSQMDKLFNSSIISAKSASDLNTLLTTTTEALNALKALNAPVDSWDLVLVHFTTRRLDSQTREAWENKQGSRTEPPSYQQLKEFLTGRARALENLQLNSSQYSQAAKTTPSSPKLSQSTTQPAKALTASHQTYVYNCSCCDGSHYIVVCEKFRELSPPARRELVITQKLCFNCLGKHSAHQCQSSKRCRDCNGKHHTMIHIKDTAQSSSKDQSTSQSKVSFTTKPVVLLATSQALLLLNSGLSQPVRILLDSGSELSFISEKLVSQLNITRQYSTIPIIGIGGTSSGSTRGIVSLPSQSIPQFKNLQLADSKYFHSSKIDIIIGADHYGQLLQPGLIQGQDSSLTAQKTIFGWVILGPEQEEIPLKVTDSLTLEELECENHFKETHSRDVSGRYIVRLPLNSSPSQLGDSYTTAQRCLKSLLNRISKNQTYSDLYHTFLKEYEDLNHMTRAPSSSSSPVYYLPHHGVLREQSTSTRLRVVFNGSCSTNSGTSLNDILHKGAKLQRDISDIDQHQNEVPYQLTTVSYGTKSAPFLSVRVILQLIEDEGHDFPLAVPVLKNGRYVDDIYGGSDHLDELILIAQQLEGLLNKGGFPLAKWQSNHPQLINTISPGNDSLQDHSFENSITKILGLSWCNLDDCFKFTF